MLWLYFIVALFIIGYSMYKLGLVDVSYDDKLGIAFAAFMVAILWPAALFFVIVFGPFYGLYLLGDRKRKQREAAKKNNK